MSDKWMTIDSAPKDGTRILAFSPGHKRAINENARGPHMRTDRWVKRYNNFAHQLPEAPYTHWMPLPTGPKDASHD